MEKTIEVAVSLTKVNRLNLKLTLPEGPLFYRKFHSCTEEETEYIFAIIPKGKSRESFQLIKTSTNKQQSDDFHLSDCKNEYWVTGTHNPLRHDALQLLKGDLFEFQEMTEEAWLKEHNELINNFKDCLGWLEELKTEKS